MNRRRILSWLLLSITILLLITGFGITHPTLITPATAGLLEKNISYRLHIHLWGPFIILLVLHLFPGFLRFK